LKEKPSFQEIKEFALLPAHVIAPRPVVELARPNIKDNSESAFGEITQSNLDDKSEFPRINRDLIY
jgi:hypothetical protein